MKIGITGSNGILGSEFIKLFNKKDVRSFQGRIEKIKDVENGFVKIILIKYMKTLELIIGGTYGKVGSILR